MDKHGYEHIKDYRAEVDVENVNGPIVVPDIDSDIWYEISENMERFVEEKNKQVDNDKKVPFGENITNIITGAINLINFLIDSQNKTPIKTLIFLDKSARLGAHVFRVLWSSLEKQGKLPQGISMPVIKFINVGLGENHKHNAKRSLDLAAEVFPKEDIEGEGVLVIDEIVDSGGSLRRAMKSLQDKYGSKPQGMANFISLPRWYGREIVKGVEDPNLPIEVYDYLENAKQIVFNFIKSLVESDVPEDFLLKFLTDPTQIEFKEFLKKYKTDGELSHDKSLLFKVYEELKHAPEKVTASVILKYFRSSGGFTALRPDKEAIRMSYRYREYLTKMVELATQHISLQG